MTEQEPQERQDQQDQQEEEHRIPKSRFDQESQKRQEAERQVREARSELQRMKDSREQEESEREQSQGQWQKSAEREQKKREQAEKDRDKAISDLVTYKTQGSFTAAARGIIRADAIDDAYRFLTPDELTSLKDADGDRYEAAARRLAESRPYLADGPRGSGAGGSGRPAASDTRTQNVPTNSPLRNKQKRRTW